MLLEITDTNRDLGEKEKEKVFNKGKTGKYLVEIENMKVLERFFSNSEMQPYIISKITKERVAVNLPQQIGNPSQSN